MTDDWDKAIVRMLGELVDKAEAYRRQMQADHDAKFPNGPPLNPDDDLKYRQFLQQIREMRQTHADASDDLDDE